MHNLGSSTNAGKDKGGKCFPGFEVFKFHVSLYLHGHFQCS
jgi:hypothetical protein